jgi:selenocysteine lyase/cysteine desulfurase
LSFGAPQYNERTILVRLMKIQDIRQEFPALQQQVFLDSCVSLAPKRAVERLRAFLDMAAYWPSGSSTRRHLDMDPLRSAARPQLARLINAGEDDVALVESTTHGLNRQSIRVVTPEERSHRSGIVTFTLGGAEDNIALTNFLQEHKVLVSVRYTSGVGGVRVSFHLFNVKEDLDRLLEPTGTFLRQHAKATA